MDEFELAIVMEAMTIGARAMFVARHRLRVATKVNKEGDNGCNNKVKPVIGRRTSSTLQNHLHFLLLQSSDTVTSTSITNDVSFT